MDLEKHMQKLLFLALFLTSCLWCQEKQCILVSVPAYTEIVQELVGDLATVRCLVPSNVNFHTYEPRPKDMEGVFSSSLWFSLMGPFEDKIAHALLSHHITMKRIDLRANLPLIKDSCCNTGTDPHIWLDPHLMKTQLETIAGVLRQQFPEQQKDIDNRLATLLDKTSLLISQVDALLKPMKGRIFVVAHGAYGYLCKQYGIEQLSLEQEGKEPSLASFTALIQKAQSCHVKTVFSLRQYPKTGIEKVAEILGARVIDLDPYSEKYFENILCTAKLLREAMDEESLDHTL